MISGRAMKNFEKPAKAKAAKTSSVDAPKKAKKVTKPKTINPAEGSDGTADSTASIDDSTSVNDISPNSTPRSAKSVRFSQIEIREYERTLGDHPGTQAGGQGPPITIEWEHHTSNVVDLDEYENAFESSQRRGKQELFMPAKVRQQMLKQNHSAEDMRRAQRNSWRIRNNRSMASATQDLEVYEVAWQSAVRKFKRWRKKSSGEEPEPAEAWVDAFKNMSIEEREKVFGDAAQRRSSDASLSSSLKLDAKPQSSLDRPSMLRAHTT